MLGIVAARITVRLTPRAARDEIVGLRDGTLLARVAAPPVDGAANEALERLLARALGVPMRDVSVVSGGKSRQKGVSIAGLSEEDVWSKLGVA
jgi:uncharacterized protein (TIGR00251 family)